MKLRVIAKPTLTLKQENMVLNVGEEFEVTEERGAEILKATFNGKPVVEYVPSEGSAEADERIKALEEQVATLEAEKASLVEELEAANKLLAEDDSENVNENKKNNKKDKGEDK